MNHLGHVAKTIGSAKPYSGREEAHENIIHTIFWEHEDFTRHLPGKIEALLTYLEQFPGDDAYLAAAFESILVFDYRDGVKVIEFIEITLDQHKRKDSGVLYPAALVGILRAADWLDKNLPASVGGLLETLPLTLGRMLVSYASVAYVTTVQARPPSVQFVNEFGRALGTFLNSEDNRTAIRRLRNFSIALGSINVTDQVAEGVVEEALGKIRSKLSLETQAKIFADYFEELEKSELL